MCDECLGGFFFIWIFQFIASLLLFIIISIAAVLFIEFDAPSPQNRNRESTYIYHSQSAPSSEIELTELDEECKVSHEPSAPPPPNV